MRKPLYILLALVGAVSAWAQRSDDQERRQPEPVENLWFDTDELIYVPKFTLSTSLRDLTGTKASFGGVGHVASSTVWVGPQTGYYSRYYQDGQVLMDSRTDSTGTYVASSDGKTNNWSYKYDSQQVALGYIAMHSYVADIPDSGGVSKDMGNSMGVEVAVSRDMGTLYRNIKWSISAGLSMNDIRAKSATAMNAVVSTTTDIYSLYGVAAPTTPYTSSGSTTSTLISADPVARTYSSTLTNSAVTNYWEVKGGYMTFRAGPTLYFPITNNLRITFGLGGALAYVGSTYSIDQRLTPNATDNPADVIQSVVEDTTSKAVAGFYVDANVEYWLSEKTGFFAGATYQNTGSYTQSVKTVDTDYSTQVDLSSMSGLRMGMNYKF